MFGIADLARVSASGLGAQAFASPGPFLPPSGVRARGRRRASRYLRACRAFLPPRPGAMGLMPAARAFSGCRACPRPPCRLPACCAPAAPGRAARPGMRASAGGGGEGALWAPAARGAYACAAGAAGEPGARGTPSRTEPGESQRQRPRLGASPAWSRVQSGAGRAQGLQRTPLPRRPDKGPRPWAPDPAPRARPGPRTGPWPRDGAGPTSGARSGQDPPT